jgi:hypothetical protein
VDFYIDTIAPNVGVSYPAPSATYNNYGVAEANGWAQDTVGVAQVLGRLRRESDGYYWNGSGWVYGARDVVAQGTTSWRLPFAALSAGTYTYQALARDYVGNTGYSALVRFTVSTRKRSLSISRSSPRISNVTLSTAAVSIPDNSVELSFAGALDAASAADAPRFHVEVEGQRTPVEFSIWDSSSNLVRLKLPPATLRAGDEISVTWRGLRDAQGLAVADGTWSQIARSARI